MIFHPRLGQASSGRDETVDPPFRMFAPKDVEGAELGVELEMRVRQVIMDPPGQGTPVGAFSIAIGEPGNDDAGRSTFVAIPIEHVPDVIPRVVLDARTMSAFVAEGGYVCRPIPRPDGKSPECILKRLQ